MQNAKLQLKIQNELREAQLKMNETVISTLRMLIAAINNKEIEKRTKLSKIEPVAAQFDWTSLAPEEREKLEELSKLSDEEVIDVISSEAKKRKEAILEYEKGGRPELAQKEKQELEILQKYLPEQLSEDELRKLVKDAVEKTGAKEIKDMGRIMAELMPKTKGRADGGLVSKIVKELLT